MKRTLFYIMNKKLAILAVYFFLSNLELNAQAVYFNFTNGTNSSFNLNEIQKITFSADVMNLHFWSGSIYSWNVSTIEHYQYDEITAGIENLAYNSNHLEVVLCPNPTSTELSISMKLSSAENISLALLDYHGKTVFHKPLGKLMVGDHQIPIDLSLLPNGSYIFQISGNSFSFKKPIIKN